MESGETYGSVIGRMKKVDKTRRTWIAHGEDVLITALKDVITKGWKSKSGFKAGYLTLLESAMHAAIPGCTLRGNPHINSKVHVWKKTYSMLVTLLGKSGVGWNDTDNTTDSTFRTMRHKQWTHYPDWCEIFENDRATDEHFQSFENALKDVLKLNDDVPSDLLFGDAFAGDTQHGDDDSISETTTPSSKPKVATTSKKIKPKQINEVDEAIVTAINNLADITKVVDGTGGIGGGLHCYYKLRRRSCLNVSTSGWNLYMMFELISHLLRTLHSDIVDIDVGLHCCSAALLSVVGG
ncbi:hypothetical protein F511_09770 [Dorcoceras hygrometricum]|uniref:Myb/SANT-like domain-containing protein n=1 Tax=Dorcoceras hygrometricum TaxID=472368 RepID=A0A2Z7D4V1_9LAMI|nr:hypothetical protein F511_09770 [Dorcoceras hygrometricum]